MFNSKKGCKLFIVEGENREKAIFDIIQKFPFPWDKNEFITLPAGQNIYMLWNTLKEDDYETDLLEIIKEKVPETREKLKEIDRDDVEEIYLFFDYDAHQRNLPIGVDANYVIKKMLETFSNETDLGKLYISYPMIEAVRDWIDSSCDVYTHCVWDIKDFGKYKEISGKGNYNANIGKYQYPEWSSVVNDYVKRISCLFSFDRVLTYSQYKELVSPQTIFEHQNEKFICAGKVFLLSAIPEFLLDYFSEDFWRKWIKGKKFKNCNNYNKN